MEVDFFLEDQPKFFRHFDKGVERNQVFIDVEDVARLLSFADCVSEVEIVLQAEAAIATREAVLAKDNAKVLVSNCEILRMASLPNLVDQAVGVDRGSDEKTAIDESFGHVGQIAPELLLAFKHVVDGELS